MTPKKCILLAEDDPSILRMTSLRLQHEGYAVVQAADGQAALQAAEGELTIHLVLLDIKLPKLDGLSVCRALKRRPETAGIPIIVFSASESRLRRLAERCIEVGADDWIRKPFRSAELLEKIRRALGEPNGREASHG
jgi:two-component system phosphate regulon response regulator PhoB